MHSGGERHCAGLLSCVLRVSLIELWEHLNYPRMSDINRSSSPTYTVTEHHRHPLSTTEVRIAQTYSRNANSDNSRAMPSKKRRHTVLVI